jgi:hypothetical protein
MNVYRSDTLGNTHSLEYIKSVHKGSQLALLNATVTTTGGCKGKPSVCSI